jgi:hypothetical protein
MNAAEKRQAGRVIRATREAERWLFELVNELQESRADDDDNYVWDSALHHLGRVQKQLPTIIDLILAIKREVGQ